MSKRLLELSNGNLTDPSLIKSVVKFPRKGVALRNEFNKMIDFIRETEDDLQVAIVKEMREVIAAGNDWDQPAWLIVFAAVRNSRVDRNDNSTNNGR